VPITSHAGLVVANLTWTRRTLNPTKTPHTSRKTNLRLVVLVSFISIISVGFLLWRDLRRHPGAPSVPAKPRWVLAWSDEFDGANGAAPDPAKWVLESGGNGWGNHELQYYTPRPLNVRQENGHLVIEALKEQFTGPDGVRRNYTSARLETKGRFSQRYGRFEARIQIPSGRGLWPAFSLFGENLPTAGWPACGEIDVMENIGNQPGVISGSLHGPGYSGGASLTGVYQLPSGRFCDGFHVFAVEWEPEAVRFFVDGELYATRTPADLPPGGRWVFDHPFFLVLNLAVGGNLPGSPVASTVFPQRMLVDYVRVYSRT
jgi:beta-glucanase (GH16 family)